MLCFGLWNFSINFVELVILCHVTSTALLLAKQTYFDRLPNTRSIYFVPNYDRSAAAFGALAEQYVLPIKPQ